MHINLPSGDVLVPDAEFLKQAGDVTSRTGRDWDARGCPYVMIAGRKYRPLNEALVWLTSQIKRRNQPRAAGSAMRRRPAPVTLPSSLPDTS
jgi:hypothetical protein